MAFSIRVTFAKNIRTCETLPSHLFRSTLLVRSAFGHELHHPGGRTTWIWGDVPLDSSGHSFQSSLSRLSTVGGQPSAPRFACRSSVICGYDRRRFNPDFVMGFSPSSRCKRLTGAATLDWQEGPPGSSNMNAYAVG